MNRTKHRQHRHDGEGRARPLATPEHGEGGSGAPNAEDQSRKQEQNRHARTPHRGVPTRPPVRSVAVWGPIAAVTVLAFLVTIGVWRQVHERGQEKAFTKQATQLEVNVVTAQRDRKPQELILPGTFQGFKEIIAPFGGKISARNIDVGTLVTAGTGNAGTALFSIVQSDPLRVYVFAPQANAPSIHEGLAAKILVQEFPGQDFDGTVTRTAGALDPQSRTMQVEVQVPNHEGRLYAGMYGQVKFLLADENAPLVVPANAFLFRTQGPQVATVANDNRIHWQTIHVGRDFGTQLEVLDGLAENTKIVMNPTDDLGEGIQVQVKPTEKPKGDTSGKPGR